MNLTDSVREMLDEMVPRPLILAHHYQRDSVVELADFRGDSLGLAQKAAASGGDRPIVFAGVHFMAETAEMLTPPTQRVYVPEMKAGCPMADMATPEGVELGWNVLAAAGLKNVVPVTYINSSARLKAFVGRHDGAVCTSSNAGRVLTWALSHGRSVFFFPDRHLGENTALALGIEPDRIILWDEDRISDAPYRKTLAQARVILWPGFCPIHRVFMPSDVSQARKQHPGCHVTVHPECRREVVEAADSSGSTGRIIEIVAQAPEGSIIVVGTESTLVRRLARETEGKQIFPLRVSVCRNMAKTTLPKLHHLIAALKAGRHPAPVLVDPEVAAAARIALDRMLELG